MSPPLFYLEQIPPHGEALLLSGVEGHHAARVRRVASGEAVLVADGAGTLLHCIVTRVDGGDVHLRIGVREVLPAPTPRMIVVQALPKGERAELAVEVLTELGVDEIVPWAASRSVTQWFGARGEKSLGRWRRTAREAAKQSRRPVTPTVADLATTDDVAARIADARGLVLHEAATSPLAGVDLPAAGDLVVVVGPEGGVSPEELDAFVAAGAASVRLGDPVLRTSTAGAAALAALSLRLGRWS